MIRTSYTTSKPFSLVAWQNGHPEMTANLLGDWTAGEVLLKFKHENIGSKKKTRSRKSEQRRAPLSARPLILLLVMSISPASVTNPPGSGTEELNYQLDNAGRCPHLKNVLGDVSKRTEILTKYRAVIAWNVNRTQQVLHPHPAKRRKVKLSLRQCEGMVNLINTDIFANVWSMWYHTFASIYLFALLVCWMLAQGTHCGTPESEGA